MEKEPQPDSMAAVTIKPEYAPSEVYSTEPPPVRGRPWGIDLAYHKPRDSAVQIAKIIAVTVVVCSVVLGGFLLASAYVTANASCRQLEQELELLSEAADRFQAPVPQPEALVQDEPIQLKRHVDPLQSEESKSNTKEIETNSIDNESEGNSDSSSESSGESEEDDKTPIHIKLPLQLDLDDLAGAILDKNQKSKMNCIVEKKKAEEVVDHQPKTIRLPFGVNLTTDPRFERLSGERMVIVCESGSFQRSQPQPQPQPQEDDDDQVEDTIMIQPVMIPIPHTPYQTHMPQQMSPMMPPQQRIQMMPPQQRGPMMPPQAVQMVFEQAAPMRPPMHPPMHPMETMRPPMPPMMRPQVQIIQSQPQSPIQGQPQPQGEFPPNPVLHHIIQQIIAQKIMESQRAREDQMRQMQQQQMQQQHMQQQHQQPQPQRLEIQQQPQRLEIQQQPQRLEIQQQPQQIEIQQQVDIQQPRQETTQSQETDEPDIPMKFQMMQRLPIPEEVLTQLNRLPNRNVIVAVSESDSSEENPQEVRFVQEQRQNAAEMNGRQTFARGLPVNIPVAMMPQQEQEQESQEPQAAASEETRPHYVQPRSVRSVDNPFKDQKRVKRCACDCAC